MNLGTKVANYIYNCKLLASFCIFKYKNYRFFIFLNRKKHTTGKYSNKKTGTATKRPLLLFNLNCSRMKMKKSVCTPYITHITGITYITVYSSAIPLCFLFVP